VIIKLRNLDSTCYNTNVPIWIFVIVIMLILGVLLSFLRIRISRDPGKEGNNDTESTLAYSQVSRGLIFLFIRFLMINRLKRYHPLGTFVDAGCGPGNLVMALHRKYPFLKITGIDLSYQMIDIAVKKLSRGDFKHCVDFQQADVCQLPFTDNSIDFVISTLSLHHWTNPGLALQEITRVLKPGGQMLIFDLRRDEPLLVYYTGQVIQRFFIPSHIRRVNGAIGSIWSSYTPEEMKNLLSKSSFWKWEIQAGWAWGYIWTKKSIT
jgi:ubiquinone/menaquinone biosynthesis C-methylase UbiE